MIYRVNMNTGLLWITVAVAVAIAAAITMIVGLSIGLISALPQPRKPIEPYWTRDDGQLSS